jgi:hypothetical protein
MDGLSIEHLFWPFQFARPGADAYLTQALEVLAAVDSKTTLIALRRGDDAAGFEQLKVARCDAHGFSSGAYVDLLNCCGVGVHRYNDLVDTTDTV